jgi:hypothetical protein
MNDPMRSNEPPVSDPPPSQAVDDGADLDWLAFRYVSGEMTAEEHAAFEENLAESQPAREAVAAAVLLAQAVGLAEKSQADGARAELVPASRSARGPTWRGRLGWALAGAAASLFIASGLQLWRDSSRAPHLVVQNCPVDHEDLSALARQWTVAGDFDPDDADDENADRRGAEDPMGEGQSPLAIAGDLFDDLVAPDWLLSAVSSGEQSPMSPPMHNPDG